MSETAAAEGANRPRLHAIERGAGGRPLMLLHGFAQIAERWLPILDSCASDRQVIAFDLPGHGGSASYPTSGRTAAAAEAILEEMRLRGIDAAHFCGHSMGGAVACLVALKSPQSVLSLTLLAPGGFGSEINSRLLRRFATADTHETLLPLLEQHYGWRTPVNQALADVMLADRQRANAGKDYLAIAELFLDGDEQKELSRDAIAALGIPVKVIWGTQDRVTPTRHAHKLPGEFAIHVFDGVGHSIIDEIPDAVVRLIRENCR